MGGYELTFNDTLDSMLGTPSVCAEQQANKAEKATDTPACEYPSCLRRDDGRSGMLHALRLHTRYYINRRLNNWQI
jgi:hypothetical protein